MVIKRPFKYNPAFLSEQELLDSFCVRKSEFEILMRCIKENTGEINQHLMLVGIRGSGKTMLLRRIVAEIKRDNEFSSKWYPVVFSEENYEILTLDDFWLKSLYYLDSAESGYDELRCSSRASAYRSDNSIARYDELKRRGNRDPYSEDIGLSRLLDFADAQDKRILLICENIQDMLSVIPEIDAWRLRNVLQTDNRIMLLGSATARFHQIEDYKQPFYEFFKVVSLKRLSQSDCKKLWISVTKNDEISDDQARALRILTGGLPRLLIIIALFGEHLSFVELIRDLEVLIDDHTEYFKGHMEALPSKERKVFATLARLWQPSASSEVAREARMEQTETSSLISRLVNRGAVEEFSIDGAKKQRTKLYQLTERLYNIYYLMRSGGKYSLWADVFIEFLAKVYGKKLSNELDSLDTTKLDETTKNIYERLKPYATSEMTASSDVADIGDTDEKSADIRKMNDEIEDLYEKGKWTEESLEKALNTLEKSIAALGKEHPETARAYHNAGIFYNCIGNYESALEYYDKALKIMKKILGKEHPGTATSYNNIANVYAKQGEYDKALEYYDKALKIWEKVLGKKHPGTLGTIRNISNVRRCFENIKNYDKALECLTMELNYPDHVSEDLQRINDLCMDIAAVSHDKARSLIELIENSPSRDVLSPLTAGIKNYLGIEFRTPLEIREISDDIKIWIEERRRGGILPPD
jgi:pentatricopeptide repeat protein